MTENGSELVAALRARMEHEGLSGRGLARRLGLSSRQGWDTLHGRYIGLKTIRAILRVWPELGPVAMRFLERNGKRG